jgi:hypothetical protein
MPPVVQVHAPVRRLQPELLDKLPAGDPRAIRGRRDLRRVNTWMGNAQILADAIRRGCVGSGVCRLADIGAGDGTLLLEVARRLAKSAVTVEAKLVDQQNLLESAIAAEFRRFGWQVEAVESNVFTWLADAAPVDVLSANLFLHHFDETTLQRLFDQAARVTKKLVACEPRRFAFPRLCGLLLRVIGCSTVAWHDGVLSVQAGFTGQELSALWPAGSGWQLGERNAGLFSHLFTATRRRQFR